MLLAGGAGAGGRELLLLGATASVLLVPLLAWGIRTARREHQRVSDALSVAGFGALAFFAMSVSLMIAEAIGNTSWFLYLRLDVGVPITLLRLTLLSLTALPAVYLVGSWIVRRTPSNARQSLLGAAIVFALAIAVLPVVHYEWSVWSSSLLKVLLPVGGLCLAYRSRATSESV